MPLTPAQLVVLKADILADPVLSSQPNNSDGAFAIRAAYAALAAPAYYVWKSAVSVSEIMGNGFDWTRVDNLTVGKARIWEFMTAVGTLNPSQANVRAGFEACFSVEVGDQPNRQAIYNHSQRQANRFEKLFAVGVGTASTHHGVGPATMAVEGLPSIGDIETARNLP